MRILQVTCAIGLIVQIVMLVMQFVQYKTVVDVELQSGQYDTLPAITICLPIYISVRKVADKYSNVSEIIEAHQQYENAIANITEDSNDNGFRKKLNSLYLDKFVAFVERRDLSVDELFNLTVPYKQPDINRGILFGIGAIGSLIVENGSSQFVPMRDERPIESLMLGHSNFKQKRKCFTFFSQLNQIYRHYKFRLDVMGIQVRRKLNSYKQGSPIGGMGSNQGSGIGGGRGVYPPWPEKF